MKTCTMCGIGKRRSDFNRCAAKAGGLSYWCRECQRSKRLAYYRANRDEELAQIRSYYRKNEAAIRARRRARVYTEHDKEVARRYKLVNAERLREQRLLYTATVKPWRRWRAANPQRSREQCRRQQARRWFGAKANPVSYDAVFDRDRGMCYLCLEQVERRVAHFDHVVPLVAGGEHSFSNIRTTHPACNLRKGRNLVSPGAFVKRSA